MPANNTAASTFHEDDLQRIIFERRQACLELIEQESISGTPLSGKKKFFYLIFLCV